MEPGRQSGKLGGFTVSSLKIKLIIIIMARKGFMSEPAMVRSLFAQLLGKMETQTLKTERNKASQSAFYPSGFPCRITHWRMGWEGEREEPVLDAFGSAFSFSHLSRAV